ncbi:deoxyguanosinetriphosphate triphosphohydrolase family protein [Streptomyces sp. NPDC048258]|uniref:deoxyguanosinetriphosphate triphosphohydrolase family protein n=1 Tax=Streptomyces sp. NPDC048258 TaxID=3365527 RepID=UPI003712BD5B
MSVLLTVVIEGREMRRLYDSEPWNATDRAYEGKGEDAQGAWGRTRYEQDRDRVLYSSAFRRLAGVTQTSAVNERRLLHNRLTHSLKVAQIGRRIAQRLQRNYGDDWANSVSLSPDIVEAAGLAHDLGHPPFGHIAERVLDSLTKDVCGGFEGNAQSLRIVTKLSVRLRPPGPGLDLTRETLNGVLKYPRLRAAMDAEDKDARPDWTDRGYGVKWGAYTTEAKEVEFARRRSAGEVRSINAVIMDWADDVGFATHDLDDYFRAGLIPLHNPERDRGEILAHAGKRLGNSLPRFDSGKFAAAYSVIREYDLKNAFGGTREDRYRIHNFVSGLIQRCVEAVTVLPDPPYVKIANSVQYEVEALKELTWFYVIESPALGALQEGQRRLVEGLYRMLTDWLVESQRNASLRIPAPLKEIADSMEEDQASMGGIMGSKEAQNARAVMDYICTLTEDQALDMYERITGTYRGSLFGGWF